MNPDMFDDDTSTEGSGGIVGDLNAVVDSDGVTGRDISGDCSSDHDASILNLEGIKIPSEIGAAATSTQLESDRIGSFVDDALWNLRIQDTGCTEDKLKKKVYCRNKVMCVGPAGNKLFYYDLTALAVDINKIIRDPLHRNEWSKIPKNPTQVKEKNFERLLALRQKGSDGKFVLDQNSIFSFLKKIWGKDSISLAPHPNDRVRLYGIVLSIPQYRFALQRLCDGVKSRDALDNPEL